MIKKIAHVADIHVRKVPTRNEEYEQVFNNLFKSLKKEKPDRIVVVGDLGHNYIDLGTEQLVLIKKFLKGLAEIAPVRITRGNHDFRKKNSKRLDAVGAIVQTIDDPNIIYYDKTGFHLDDNVMWAVWHHGVKNNNPWKTREAKKVLAWKSESGYTHIDLFHDPINGCKSTTGFEMKKKSYYKLKDFQGDYSFLGDIHLQQYFANKTKAYCGTLIAQDFSEGDDQFHGYLLWDIESGEVEEIPIHNDWSFKNIRLNPYTDFDDLEIEIEDPTPHMRVRFVWSTLPAARNKENERRVIEYIKQKHPNVIISHKNEFVEDDTIDVGEDLTIEDISSQEIQHDIFKNYLDKIGLEENIIDDIISLDDEITKKIEVDPITNIEWSVIKFGGENFMSYKEIDIDWRDMEGLYQITGENTAGKTTIMKLISYILFSKTLETESRVKYGDSRFVNNKTDLDYCEGYLVLEANGEYYGIKRRTDIERKKDGEIKGAPTKVWYYTLASPDDEMNDDNCIDALTDDDRIKTQKIIDQIIGGYDNFMRIVMTTSDTLNKILSNDMAEFIDSLLYDSGLDVFDKKLTGIKEHLKEINQKSRINCNVTETENHIENLKNEIKEIDDNITQIKSNQIPDVEDRIKKGEDYIETLTKKLFKIDPEIANLDVQDTIGSIKAHQTEIDRYLARKSVVEDSIVPLKETYNEERYNELLEQKEEHKQSVYDINLEKKEFERKKEEENHKIEIVNGNIHVLKQRGSEKKDEIKELKESKTCPTCGQPMTAEHRKHVDEKIKKIEKEMFEIADQIKEHEKVINDTHKPKIQEYVDLIKKNNDTVSDLETKMEEVLAEIGELTNDKNDVEKRKELQTELNQIPTKIENEELKRDSLQKKIKDHENSKLQIEENSKIQFGIDAAKKRLELLREELEEKNETIYNHKNRITQHTEEIEKNEQIIKDFKEQEYQDLVMNTYKKCVHRDGIPRQLLSNYIIPKINVQLEKVLSVAPFKVWLDVDDLRPKLAYYNTPHAVIDAIGSSGKERTFASVVLKMALNEINVKSKPTMFLLDEVMGKLKNDSVEEFVEILGLIKEKCKQFLIIEPVHEVHPDYIIDVVRTNDGISSVNIE
jgi:DNA repair exonuclease SbcCD ATPase subunit